MADRLKELQDLLSGLNVPQNPSSVQVPYAAGMEPTEDQMVNVANDIVQAENAPKEPTKSEQIDFVEQINQEAEKMEQPLPIREPAVLPELLELKKEEKPKSDKDLKQAQLMDMLSQIGNAMSKYGRADIPEMKTTDYTNQLLNRRMKEADQKTRADYMQGLLEGQKESRELKKRQMDISQKRYDLERATKQEKEDRLQAKDDQMARKRYLDSARGLIKDDPRFKKAVEQGMEFESVDRLLNQVEAGNQAALGALGTKLARAMGEVGVLTDTDVVRYVAGQSWGRKLKDWAAKGMQGELSESTLKDIRQNLGMLRDKLKEDTNRVYDAASGRMKTAYPELDDKTIGGLLGKPVISESAQKEEAKQMSPVAARQEGETWEDNNFMYRMKDGKIQRKAK